MGVRFTQYPQIINTMVIVKKDEEVKQFKYCIQRRVWQDAFWYKAWQRNMEVKWSEWKSLASFDKLEVARTVEDTLNKTKLRLKFTVEYRLMKN